MNIAQNLVKLLGETRTSRSKLAREIGVHTTTVTNWLEGRAIDSKNLLAVANYFGVSVDYLSGIDTKKEPTTNGDELDEATKELVEIWNSANDEGKKMLLDLARFLKSQRG